MEGFADDYAFLIRGLIDLYEADPRRETGWRWLRWARELQARGQAYTPSLGLFFFLHRRGNLVKNFTQMLAVYTSSLRKICSGGDGCIRTT